MFAEEWICCLEMVKGLLKLGMKKKAVGLCFLCGYGIGPEGGFLSDILRKVVCP